MGPWKRSSHRFCAFFFFFFLFLLMLYHGFHPKEHWFVAGERRMSGGNPLDEQQKPRFPYSGLTCYGRNFTFSIWRLGFLYRHPRNLCRDGGPREIGRRRTKEHLTMIITC